MAAQLACNAGDMPSHYFQQVDGDFTPRDVAALAGDPAVDERDLVDAGMLDGYFGYWTERLDRPPFDLPHDVVCQVLRFEGEADAAAYVETLEPGPGLLATTAIGWFPQNGATFEEIGDELPGVPPQVRIFRLVAEPGDGPDELLVAVWAHGRHVPSVYTAAPEGDADADLLEEIVASILARTAHTAQESEPET